MIKSRVSSIGRRIGALVAVSVLMTVLVIASLLVWLQAEAGIKNKKSALEATGYVYASAIADDMVGGNKQRVSNVLRSIARVPDILYATALGGRGEVIATMGQTTFLQDDMVIGEQGVVSMMTKGVLPVAADIVRSGKTVGRLIIIADIRPMRSALFWTSLQILVAAVIASLAGVAIAIPLQHRITAPILALTRAMRHIAEARDYTMTVERTVNDETGVLVDSFNTMIAEIAQRDSSLMTLGPVTYSPYSALLEME